MSTQTDTYQAFLAAQAAQAEAARVAAEDAALRATEHVRLLNGNVVREAAYAGGDEQLATRWLRAGTITRDEYVAQFGPPTTELRR